MSPSDVIVRAAELAREGRPFVLATVVAVAPPASTRRGDRALVTPDGALHGWIGGACSEPLVIRESVRALADGEPRLLRIGPPGVAAGEVDDVVVAESTCASEGTIDVLLEPQLAAPLLAVLGTGPAARTLAELARTIGWRVADDLRPEADAVVVATMGHGDEDALAEALAGVAGYVGLVASARRAATVLESLRARGLDEPALARLRSPAGLDLGPSSQPEIAVAILAELVAWRHLGPVRETRVAEAVDPVCGMTVALGDAAETAVHDGVVYGFCSTHCRHRFEEDPVRFVSAPI